MPTIPSGEKGDGKGPKGGTWDGAGGKANSNWSLYAVGAAMTAAA